MTEEFKKYRANEEAVNQAIEVLNRALNKDRGAISLLLLKRWVCNESILEDQTIQARQETVFNTVSAFGLINGILGIQEDGRGYLTMVVKDDVVTRIERTTARLNETTNI